MRSWKTTVGGILWGGGLLFAAKFPEWARWGELAAGLGTVILGLAARDNDKTSEDVGAARGPSSGGDATGSGPAKPASVPVRLL